jgi:hypothetical protein
MQCALILGAAGAAWFAGRPCPCEQIGGGIAFAFVMRRPTGRFEQASEDRGHTARTSQITQQADPLRGFYA